MIIIHEDEFSDVVIKTHKSKIRIEPDIWGDKIIGIKNITISKNFIIGDFYIDIWLIKDLYYIYLSNKFQMELTYYYMSEFTYMKRYCTNKMELYKHNYLDKNSLFTRKYILNYFYNYFILSGDCKRYYIDCRYITDIYEIKNLTYSKLYKLSNYI